MNYFSAIKVVCVMGCMLAVFYWIDSAWQKRFNSVMESSGASTGPNTMSLGPESDKEMEPRYIVSGSRNGKYEVKHLHRGWKEYGTATAFGYFTRDDDDVRVVNSVDEVCLVIVETEGN